MLQRLDVLPPTAVPVETPLESGLFIVQAQMMERANTAEAEVGRLSQEVQTRSNEGQGWHQELQQAQQELSAAQVCLT